MSAKRVVFILVLAGLLSGCGTLSGLFLDARTTEKCSWHSPVYVGIRVDGYWMYTGLLNEGGDMEVAERVNIFTLGLLDLPWSAVLDTLLLPLTITNQVMVWSDCIGGKDADTQEEIRPLVPSAFPGPSSETVPTQTPAAR